MTTSGKPLKVIGWKFIENLEHDVARSEIDVEIINCDERSARFAIFNDGDAKKVEITAKGIGDTMEVKKQIAYITDGETKHLDFPFSIKVKSCEGYSRVLFDYATKSQ